MDTAAVFQPFLIQSLAFTYFTAHRFESLRKTLFPCNSILPVWIRQFSPRPTATKVTMPWIDMACCDLTTIYNSIVGYAYFFSMVVHGVPRSHSRTIPSQRCSHYISSAKIGKFVDKSLLLYSSQRSTFPHGCTKSEKLLPFFSSFHKRSCTLTTPSSTLFLPHNDRPVFPW